LGRSCSLPPSAAAAQDVPQLTVGRLIDGESLEIDGRVEEEVWARAQPYSAFVQQEPNEGQPATERTEVKFLIDYVFEIPPQQGGTIAYIMDVQQDRPRLPFTVYQDVAGRRVIIPAGEYLSWNGGLEYDSDPSAPVNLSLRTKNGRFYDGDHSGWDVAIGMSLGAVPLVGWLDSGRHHTAVRPLQDRSRPAQRGLFVHQKYTRLVDF
jgi:hypothetical protein